jgi:hypothetical protein
MKLTRVQIGVGIAAGAIVLSVVGVTAADADSATSPSVTAVSPAPTSPSSTSALPAVVPVSPAMAQLAQTWAASNGYMSSVNKVGIKAMTWADIAAAFQAASGITPTPGPNLTPTTPVYVVVQGGTFNGAAMYGGSPGYTNHWNIGVLTASNDDLAYEFTMANTGWPAFFESLPGVETDLVPATGQLTATAAP